MHMMKAVFAACVRAKQLLEGGRRALKKATIEDNAPRRYFRREQAAAYIGCSLRQLDELKYQGELPFHRLGRRLIVFRVDDLEAFMDRYRVVPSGMERAVRGE